MKKILSLLISILISFQLFAQVELQIGNGITSYFDPLPGYYGWNRSAYLYKLDEIGVGGLVSALAFEIASPSNGSNAKIKIYLKETSATTMPALSATTWNTLKAGATLVYQNNALASSPAGWKIFTFDTQFNYSGTGNLMVLVEGEGCIASGGCRTDCYNHEAPATHWYRRKDSTPPDDNAPSTSPTGQEGKRANIKFTITPPAGFCYPPFNLAATNITSNSADITWNTHSSGISWKVQYKKAIETTWSAEQIHYLGESSLQDLDPATTYDVRVKSVCNTDESGWITVTFTTFCEAVTTFPWIENFDTYGTTSGIYPLCWFRPVLNTSIPYPSIVSGNAVSSPGSLRFLSSASLPTYAITPQMDADINTLMVTFQLRAESTLNSGTMHVGVMSNPLDLSTFELVQIITPITHNYQEYEVLFSNTTLTGAGNCIAFKHVTNSSYYYFLLDDVIVDYIPVCRRPLEVSFTNITETSVDLGWFDSGTATSWEVEYGETGFTQG
ncbi:MAG: fibronectin type III domain-containing protein, partial [Bacteroidales bacterium]